MARNYKKENEWQKNRYELISGRIEKETGKKLRIKLKKENLSVAKWIFQNATKYLNE